MASTRGKGHVPEREWILTDWIPKGYTTGLYGRGGLGKSTLAMQIATCLATGSTCLEVPTEPLKVLGVFCEDGEDELHRRQSQINCGLGKEFGELLNYEWISRVGEDNALAIFEQNGKISQTPFYYQLLNKAKSIGAKLIILDGLSDVFSGNENDRSHAKRFVNRVLDRLAQEIGGAVLIPAHPSKSGLDTGSGDSGSTGWDGAFRSRLYLEGPDQKSDLHHKDYGKRRLTRKKSNYAKSGEFVDTKLKDGVFVFGPAANDNSKEDRQRDCDAHFLIMLEKFEKMEINVSHHNTACNYAPRQFSKHEDGKRFKKEHYETSLHRHLSDAFGAPKIRIEIADNGRRGRKVLRLN